MHDLTRRGDDFTALSGSCVKPTKRFQDRADLVPRESRSRAEAELTIYVFGIEQKDAVCRLAVPSGAPG
ncbi:MAG: hypothetical protein RH980_17545, partial [Roseovarius confluentis]